MDEIVEKYKDLVYRLAFSYCRNHMDADDIFQEVFLRYYRKRPVFESEEHEKAWFIRVTINCSKSLLTSVWRSWTIELEQGVLFQDQYESDLFYAVMALPKKYRIVIELYYYEGYKVKEIAELLHRKENTVKQQLVRGRERLKNMLSEEGEVSYER